MRHEALKQKIPKLHFKPEGYISSNSEEFLDAMLELLRAEGFDPDNLIYSGFDGTKAARGEEIPKYEYIFAMNEAGWREAIKKDDSNPAEYADGWQTPCIGLYDRSQLAHVYSADIDLEDINDRVELKHIRISNNLADLPLAKPIEEAVVHKNYPDSSPTDALVGLVYLD